MDAHYSSCNEEWETPQCLFDELNDEFGFTVDVCATFENKKCKNFYSPVQDGLTRRWDGVCWMNPPYGKKIKHWIARAFLSSLKGATVVCLVPSRTDSGWWHDYAMKGEIRFIRGRIKFSNSKWNAPFPSAIVIFRPNKKIDRTKYHGVYQQTGLF